MTPVYPHNGKMMTAREIAKDLGQRHTLTRARLYAGQPPQISPTPAPRTKRQEKREAQL